jgi:hypothetical protein
MSTRYGVKEPAPVLRLVRRGKRSVSFATVLLHRRAVAGGLALRHLRRLGEENNAFEVAGVAGGAAFVDRFVLQPDVMGEYRDDMVEYSGAFLAYRRDGAGRFAFLSAARPDVLAVQREPCIRRDMRGHVEWRSVGHRGAP